MLLLSLGTLGQTPPPSSSTTISTSFDVGALAVVSAVGNGPPNGYQEGTSNQLAPREAGIVSAGYGTFFTGAGSIANVTVLVFDGPQSAQTYGYSVTKNERGLTGYTNLNGSLASYTSFGACYGFGEADPEGNGAVATGQCVKGNVYVQVMVVSTGSLSAAEADMSALVGAAYGDASPTA